MGLKQQGCLSVFVPWWDKEGFAAQYMLRVKDKFLKSVFYLYYSPADAECGRPGGGTGFMVAVPSEHPQRAYIHFVTNRHVIREGATTIRLNKKDGGIQIIETTDDVWIPHPNGDDLAIALVGGHNADDLDWSWIAPSLLIRPEHIEQQDIGVGDEAVLIGRFVLQEGKKKNIPTARFGNIAQMPDEPMPHEFGGEQESFLIDIRGISGYSGSPVFLRIHPFYERKNVDTSRAKTLLLGVDWGQIYARERVRDSTGQEIPQNWHVRSPSGVIGVVPAWKITDMLDSGPLYEARMKSEREQKERQAKEVAGTSTTVIEPVPMGKPESDLEKNPQHKADFTRLLNEAAKKREPKD